MKRTLLLVLIVLLSACHHDKALPEATIAAQEVYERYADRQDLTVALIGDYRGYNAVMLKAQNAEGWLKLCEEMGVRPHEDAVALDSTRVRSIHKVSYTDDISRMPEEVRRKITDLIESDSVATHIRIDTVYGVHRRMHYDHGVLVDSSTEEITHVEENFGEILPTAMAYGNCGYVIYYDSKQLAVWLFFYSSDEELERIMDNVTIKNTQS